MYRQHTFVLTSLDKPTVRPYRARIGLPNSEGGLGRMFIGLINLIVIRFAPQKLLETVFLGLSPITTANSILIWGDNVSAKCTIKQGF